ncbi:Rha family transcriptional regulator [Klebsiella pneumoniae]|uniref:Rha family transcriptional regulator n=1 Tax=Klebsiella pneumoniae TaxID=573 RepID=UPI003132C35F
MNIINLDQLISMTSKEIAELTGKRHDNVIRDVRKMLDEIYPDGGLLSFEDTYVNTQNGETYSMYRLVLTYSVFTRPPIPPDLLAP